MTFSAQHIKAARLHLRKSDTKLAEVIKKVGPFTAKTRRDRYGTLVRSILAQQISTQAASTILGRLEEAVIENRKTPIKRGHPFCAETVLSFSIDELRALGVSRQKASYLHSLSEHVVDNEVDLSKIGKLDDEEVIQSLIQIKGIGRWTAEMFLIFSLGRLDVFPVDDLGIKTAVKNIYRLSELPDSKTMEKIAKPWRPYASIASWYLWRSLELKE